jgi:hypothetical protein
MKTTTKTARPAHSARPAIADTAIARAMMELELHAHRLPLLPDDSDDDAILPPSTRRAAIARPVDVAPAAAAESSILDAPDTWRYPSALPADVRDVVSDETIEAIRAAFADDLSYLVDAEPTQISDLARSLWSVTRWDLPVAARVELNALASRYSEDVGFLVYAAPVLADPIRSSNCLPFGDIARAAGLDAADAARVSRAMHVFERRCLESETRAAA